MQLLTFLCLHRLLIDVLKKLVNLLSFESKIIKIVPQNICFFFLTLLKTLIEVLCGACLTYIISPSFIINKICFKYFLHNNNGITQKLIKVKFAYIYVWLLNIAYFSLNLYKNLNFKNDLLC